MVFTLDLSIVGYATSGLISGSLALIGCYLLMYLHPEVSKAIFMPDRSSFQQWRPYFKLALPQMLMTFFAGLSVQIMAFYSGLLGTTE
jgi:Na+-driven multidrug efflux pump